MRRDFYPGVSPHRPHTNVQAGETDGLPCIGGWTQPTERSSSSPVKAAPVRSRGSRLSRARGGRRSAALQPKLAAGSPVFAFHVSDQDVHRFGRTAQDLDRYAGDFFYQPPLLFDRAAFHHFNVVRRHTQFPSKKRIDHIGAQLPSLHGSCGACSAQVEQIQTVPRAAAGSACNAEAWITACMHQHCSAGRPFAMAHWFA
jgi:hypothetical protein